MRNLDAGQDDVISVAFTQGSGSSGAFQHIVEKHGRVLKGHRLNMVAGKPSLLSEELTKL